MGLEAGLKALVRNSIAQLDRRGSGTKTIVMRILGNRLQKDRRSQLQIDSIKAVRRCSIRIVGAANRVSILGQISHCEIRVEGSGNSITIERGAVIGWTEFSIIADNSEILIGRDVYINGKKSAQNLFLARGAPSRIELSDNCLVSYGVEARTSDSHKILDSEGNRINPEADIFIDRHVWIGARTSILKGCTIGEDSIIAMGSIVTKDVPSSVIAAGSPCETVKNDINWEL